MSSHFCKMELVTAPCCILPNERGAKVVADESAETTANRGQEYPSRNERAYFGMSDVIRIKERNLIQKFFQKKANSIEPSLASFVTISNVRLC